MEYKVRPMQIEDIENILEIEKVSYPTPWSAYAFRCEIFDNDFARYFVIEGEEDTAKIIGYGGMWIIVDEAHITNITVAPEHRGKKIGEIIIGQLVMYAKSKGVLRMTLEVRVSNESAQRLYGKMGFVYAGIRPGYYVDNNEDAIIMWKEIY